jgi:hypothetical protein
MRNIKLTLLVPIVAAVTMFTIAPAQAGLHVPPPPGPTGPTDPTGPTGTDPTQGGPTGDTSSSGGRVGSVGGCHVVATPGYLGMACGSGGSDAVSPKDILGEDAVPTCILGTKTANPIDGVDDSGWDEPLTAAELVATGYTGNEDNTWYWHWCVNGVNPKTKEANGPITFTVGILQIKGPQEPKHLHGHQIDFVKMFHGEGSIPSPIAGTSPNVRPRVGGWVSFFDIATPHVVTVPAGNVVLRATETHITVQPKGEGDPTTRTCAGSGYQAKPGETKINHPQGCWYRYLESSADQPGNTYPAKITSHWRVETSVAGGPWTPFTAFDKSQVTDVPVTEVQAIVVP